MFPINFKPAQQMLTNVTIQLTRLLLLGNMQSCFKKFIVYMVLIYHLKKVKKRSLTNSKIPKWMSDHYPFSILLIVLS